MGLFSKSTIPIDSAHTAPQRALDCGPGLGGNTSRLHLTPFTR